MTGRRTRLRDELERRFPQLRQFFSGCLHEDWPEMHGTPGKAVDWAISEYPIELRQQVRHELATLFEEAADDVDLRSKLGDGLGVCVHFKKPVEARAFAEQAEAKLMASIQRHFELKRRGEFQ